jgi:HTH-type transcriptional regulator/antitoxin HigA
MNKIEYSNLITFHPGYYINEIIEDMEISQDEFAKRLGVTGKTISKLVNGKIDLSEEVAMKLSIMLGTDVKTWLNLQQTYVEKCLEIEKTKKIDEEVRLVKMIDYKYFVNLGVVQNVRGTVEKVKALCSYFKVSSLNVLLEEDFLVNYRTGISTVEEKNLINSKAWLQTAINFGKSMDTDVFDMKKLNGYLPEIRSMTVKKPSEFLPRLKLIFRECGVSFVLLPSLKNAGINGAVKWVSAEKVILAMNDRRNYADTFWFSLFHEIKHVLQQKLKIILISGSKVMVKSLDETLEREADLFARDFLIPPKDYEEFLKRDSFSEENIKCFAKKLGIHEGIVVGRLQKDGYVGFNQLNSLKEKYVIN